MRDDELRRAGLSRRDVMAGAGASALTFSTPAFAQPETLATGVVFEDRSGSGMRQPGDRGIAGVMVSNGRDVVTTAPDGSWRLPLAAGDSVFVIKPPHWSTLIGAGGVPRFSYLHHPEGTPSRLNVRHAGVAPTGALPHSKPARPRRNYRRHVLTAASGAWWSGPLDRRSVPSADSADGTPNGFHVLSVDGNAYTTKFVPAAEKTSAQHRVLVSKMNSHPELIVNVFDGGPRTRVTYTIGRDITPVVMAREPVADPYIVDLFKQFRRKPWVEPVVSSHLWRAMLPGLPSGAHDITVHVRDEHGREHVSRLVLETNPAGHLNRPA